MTPPSHDDVDLEKQVSAASTNQEVPTGRTSSGSLNDADAVADDEKLADLPTTTRQGFQRSPSNVKIQTPRYISASETGDGTTAAPGSNLKLQRTFSRREPSLIHHNSHIFGGDYMSQHNEDGLVRFQSQAGKDQIIVHWEGDQDSENPQNWSTLYRWYLTGLAGFLVLNSTFTSSAPSGIIQGMESTFGFGQEVATLTISVFVAGYCVGPLLWGPISERIGRRPVFMIALFAYTCFNIGCALSPNTAAIIIFRFLSGTFAASPLTNSGGVIADIWDSKRRGIAMSIFSIAPFAGPAIGPIVSGAISVRGVDWRWLYWVCTIFSGLCLAITALTLKETFAPIILVKKARRIRKETGDDRYVAPLELIPVNFKSLLHATMAKPFIMLVQEPILAALTVFLSFVYGIVYLLFEAFPVVFVEIHGFNNLQNGLTFIPFFLGGCAAVILYIFAINPIYIRKVDAAKGGRVPPEERLYIVMIAGPSLVVAFFWFAWTSYASVSFWAPMMAGALLGFGILFCFLGIFNYIIDVYLASAASALAANTVCRSAAGAAFPLFASQMYARLGPQWASSLLGFLAMLMVPLPFLFYKYGPRIRELSKHAVA